MFRQLNSSDNLSSYPADNYRCSAVVMLSIGRHYVTK